MRIYQIKKDPRFNMGKLIKYSNKPHVYGTGLVALDIVIGSKPGEPAYQWAGGTCGNVLIILAYLGWDASPVARLNTESSSLHVKNDMQKWNLNLDFAEMSPTASVPIITQEISKDKAGNAIHKFHWRNCPKCGSWLPNYKPVTLKATEIVKEKADKCSVYFFDRTSPGALDLARHFKKEGAIIFFEPSAKSDIKHFEEAIKLADIVKYSEQRFSSINYEDREDQRPFLEIQTLGSNGLRYKAKRQKTWRSLPSFNVNNVVDTCGCGDWTTAGIIYQLCGSGLKNFLNHSIEVINDGLKYGQALGAWNCAFEGARGGMYRVTKNRFKKDINAILEDVTHSFTGKSKQISAEYASDGLCPACHH